MAEAQIEPLEPNDLVNVSKVLLERGRLVTLRTEDRAKAAARDGSGDPTGRPTGKRCRGLGEVKGGEEGRVGRGGGGAHFDVNLVTRCAYKLQPQVDNILLHVGHRAVRDFVHEGPSFKIGS